MKIIEKLRAKQENMYGSAPVTIAFLGDSVTQGCFECYKTGPNSLQTVFDAPNAFGEKVKWILGLLYPNVQVNVINSGISGDNAPNGLARFERDVAPFSPDLVVVGYALNDCCAGVDNLSRYTDALDGILKKIDAIGAEAMVLTPNMMNTDVSCHLTDELFVNLAKNFASLQNNGTLDRYADAARDTAHRNNVKVCDIYAKWKAMARGGVCVTELLANHLNHPMRELHWMTAYSIVETIFEE
ncbi:MAG: SGNH/GDSL hydrolase family protein [Eubacteriales bacterium]